MKDQAGASIPSKRRKAAGMTLKELREARQKTQVQLAQQWKVGQSHVSLVEAREEPQLSTIRGYVEALGGTVSVVAKFPGEPPILLAL